MPRRRLILLAMLGLTLLVGGLWLILAESGLLVEAGSNGAPVVSTGTPQVGGPFTLVDQAGKTVTDKDFSGKLMLIYFGFTFCPDVCPTELQVMASAMDTMGDKGAQVTPIFITVDPERDTPSVMANYVKQFHRRLVGLTGSPEQIANVAKAYRVYYEKVKDDSASGDYSMDHSSVVYLMDKEGKFLAFFAPGSSPEQMAAKIKSYLD